MTSVAEDGSPLPLAWAIERLCNGFWHLWWTIHFREYSPGLVTSILIWMDSYFIVRYRPVGETIAPRILCGAVFIGLLAASFLAFYIPLVNREGDASQGVKCKWHLTLFRGR
jgi:hypothetical protein